ncbi:endoribonuclease Dicer [Asimina triloba]
MLFSPSGPPHTPAQIYSVEDNEELESLVASPNVMLYYYDYVNTSSSCIKSYRFKLEDIRARCMASIREKVDELRDLQKNIKLLCRLHENLLFCLENLGLSGLIQDYKIYKNIKVNGRKWRHPLLVGDDDVRPLGRCQCIGVEPRGFTRGVSVSSRGSFMGLMRDNGSYTSYMSFTSVVTTLGTEAFLLWRGKDQPRPLDWGDPRGRCLGPQRVAAQYQMSPMDWTLLGYDG